MTRLSTHRPATRSDAADGDTARMGTSAACEAASASHKAGAASESAGLPAANVAIVVSTLNAMGVQLSFRPARAASESPAGNDGAQPGLPQAARRLQYEAHIASNAWKNGAARRAELEASGFRCRVCNRGPDEVRLEVHHRTYENFGCELASDLTTLCADCHVGNTDMLRRRRYADFMPVSADVAAADRRAPLFDPMASGESS
jgi:hypothetical protein